MRTVYEEWIETEDGVRLWTAKSGAGPPLVLCHGGPGLWDYLGPIAEVVDDLVTVHRWDQRGCGRSTGSAPYTIERFVADLETLRVMFGYERWMVGGHSWGATLALRYAFSHPKRVVAVAYLAGTGIGKAWKTAFRKEADRRLSPRQRRRRKELEQQHRDEVEEQEYRVLSWAPDYADRDRAPGFAAQEAAVPFPINYECNAALNDEIEGLEESTLRALCRQLEVPVLVVHGSGDPRPVWSVESMVEALPAAEVHVLPDVGHVPWLEGHKGFESVLRNFLARVA